MAVLQLAIQEYWQECCTCGMWFGVAESYDKERRKTKASFFCPNGHSQSYTQNDADRLRVELAAERKKVEQEQQRVAMERQMRWDAEAKARKAEQSLTRQTKRVNAGVCPHCNRTFKQLAAHMKCRHAVAASKKGTTMHDPLKNAKWDNPIRRIPHAESYRSPSGPGSLPCGYTHAETESGDRSGSGPGANMPSEKLPQLGRVR